MRSRAPLLVVTPTLGDSPWLDETVASVASVGVNLWHILVCPPDRVASLEARFPACRVMAESQPGRGMYAAINDGVAAADGWSAFTYLNDDDVLLPGFRSVAAAISRGAQLVYGRVVLIDSRGQRIGAIPYSRWPEFNRLLYAQHLEPVYQHGTLVARQAWDRCGGFDVGYRYCGDSEFLARLCVNDVPAAQVTVEVAAFRLRAGQLTKNRPELLKERAQIDRELGLVPARFTLRHRWARLLFRFNNAAIYAERILRHGFLTFDQLLERKG